MRRTAGGSLNDVFKFIYGSVLIGYFAGRACARQSSFWLRRSGRVVLVSRASRARVLLVSLTLTLTYVYVLP